MILKKIDTHTVAQGCPLECVLSQQNPHFITRLHISTIFEKKKPSQYFSIFLEMNNMALIVQTCEYSLACVDCEWFCIFILGSTN